MIRKFIFKDKDKEILLPVTPPSFSIEHGNRIETINIHTFGDVNIAGHGTLATIKIDCVFPAQYYSFAFDDQEPYVYVDYFLKWIDGKNILRFIVSDTPVNIAVIIESISYSEQDGTNDVYASIIMREYRELNVIKVATMGTENKSRTTDSTPVKSTTYVVKKGDTLSAICRKFYGNASLYPKLAAINNIKNPHLIYTGQVLNIPDKSQL